MKSYFYMTRLASGEYVYIVYNSEHRKNTNNHWFDLNNALIDNKVRLHTEELYGKDSHHRRIDNTYILNKKNMDDQCFDDATIIDLRK